LNSQRELGQILTKNADVSKRSEKDFFFRNYIPRATTGHAKIQLSSTFLKVYFKRQRAKEIFISNARTRVQWNSTGEILRNTFIVFIESVFFATH